VELLVGVVVDLSKDVVDGSAPDLGVVLAATGLPEDEALLGVVDEAAVHGELSPDGLRVGVAERGRATTAQDPALVSLEVANVLTRYGFDQRKARVIVLRSLVRTRMCIFVPSGATLSTLKKERRV
jgi:hypothetical protein